MRKKCDFKVLQAVQQFTLYRVILHLNRLVQCAPVSLEEKVNDVEEAIQMVCKTYIILNSIWKMCKMLKSNYI